MKVLVVTNMYPSPERPFYGVFVEEQVRSLRAQGVTIEVAFIDGATSRWNYAKAVRQLSRLISQTDFDLIHAHHSLCIYPIRVALALFRKSLPVLFTFHEGEVHNTTLRPGGVRRLVFSKRLKRAALNSANLVISVQDELMKASGYSGGYVTIPCGVDTDLFRPLDRSDCRVRLGLPLEKKLIFFPAAQTDEQKGFDVLSQSLSLFESGGVEIISAGSIPHDEIPYFMNAADVVCQLSLFEASPMALKEAMAVGARVVFTQAGDAAETMGTTPGCWVCDRSPKDVAAKLSAALTDGGPVETRERIIEKKLTLQAIADRIIDVYRRYGAVEPPAGE